MPDWLMWSIEIALGVCFMLMGYVIVREVWKIANDPTTSRGDKIAFFAMLAALIIAFLSAFTIVMASH